MPKELIKKKKMKNLLSGVKLKCDGTLVPMIHRVSEKYF